MGDFSIVNINEFLSVTEYSPVLDAIISDLKFILDKIVFKENKTEVNYYQSCTTIGTESTREGAENYSESFKTIGTESTREGSENYENIKREFSTKNLNENNEQSLADYETIIDELKKENERLRKDKNKLSMEREEREFMDLSSHDAKIKLKENLKVKNDMIRELEETIEKHEATNRKLYRENRRHKSNIEELQNENEEMTTEIKDLKESLANTKKKYKKQQESIVQFQDASDQQEIIAKLKEANEILKKKIEKMTNEANDREENLKEFQNTVEKLQDQLNKSEKGKQNEDGDKVKELEKKVEELNEEIRKKGTAMENMKKKIKESQNTTDTKKLENVNKTLKLELDSMHLKVKEYQENYDKMVLDLERVQVEKQRLQVEVSDLKKLNLSTIPGNLKRPSASGTNPESSDGSLMAKIPDWWKTHQSDSVEEENEDLQLCPLCGAHYPTENIHDHFEECMVRAAE